MTHDDLLDGAQVLEVPAALRFEIHSADGELLGIAEYQQTGTVLTITHTEVPAEHGGRGVASRLMSGMMPLVRESGRQIVPACPFVRSWLTKHPENRDLVAGAKVRQD